ncbi:MAG: thiol reductase thioredoxin [Alphaproteobacteria bacterium]|nr:thiol reductase thioredoxin [Alphaproteobacteria bacterium]MCB9690986.1 thiol reductase thioredoxin [Alphaproteobacteria bacterium]
MIVACPHCGQKNRLNPAKLPEGGTCGKCHGTLGAPSHAMEVDPATFDRVVGQSPLPVLVDFWAPWCGPCRMAAPEVERAAGQLAGRAIVLKVNTEAHPEIAQRFQIRGIPYFAVFRGGRRVGEQTGLVDASRLVGLVASA